MHVYVSDTSHFAGEFVSKFLGTEPEPVETRENISPWPPMNDPREQPKGAKNKVNEDDEE